MKNSVAVTVISALALSATSVFAQNQPSTTSTRQPAKQAQNTTQNTTQNQSQVKTQTKPQNLPSTPEAEAWQQAAQPGENQKQLNAFVGAWNCEIRFPDGSTATGTDQKSTGTSVNHFILGGRFLQTAFSANIDGLNFQGAGTWGYNNVTNQYESTWIDTMSTGIVFEVGKFDSSNKTFTMTGRYANPSGSYTSQKTVYTFQGTDRYTMNVFEVNSEGKETQTMTINCTKVTTPNTGAPSSSRTPVKNESKTQPNKVTNPAPDSDNNNDK